MSIRNTGSFPQVPRLYSLQFSTANTNYTTPTTPGLLWVAGPDGSEVWGISAVPSATINTANQIQLFTSPDGGTTFNLFPASTVMGTYTMAQTTALPVTNMVNPNGVPLGPTNPFVLAGATGLEQLVYAQSTLSEPTWYYQGGVTQGTANAQTMPYAVNSAGTELTASPAYGTILDFTAGATNTSTTTIAPGLQGAVGIKRTASVQLSAGDLTIGFRYRAWWDGTEWILMLTQRLYCAQGQAQASVFSAWGRDL